jgi:hypothetical protein
VSRLVALRARFAHLPATGRVLVRAIVAASVGAGAIVVALAGSLAQGVVLAAVALAVGARAARGLADARRLWRLARVRRRVGRGLRELRREGWRVEPPPLPLADRRLAAVVVTPERELGFALAVALCRREAELAAAQAAASWLGLCERPFLALLAAPGAGAEAETDASGVLVVDPDGAELAMRDANAGFLAARAEAAR